jgi:hypothetical protein
MNYQPKFIKGKTIDELKAELQQMYNEQYKYGYSINRPRMWDINYTIKALELNPILNANGEPLQYDKGIIEFSR